MDSLQRLRSHFPCPVPHCGTQMPELRVLQYQTDTRRPCSFMLIGDCRDGEMISAFFPRLRLVKRRNLNPRSEKIYSVQTTVQFFCNLPCLNKHAKRASGKKDTYWESVTFHYVLSMTLVFVNTLWIQMVQILHVYWIQDVLVQNPVIKSYSCPGSSMEARNSGTAFSLPDS